MIRSAFLVVTFVVGAVSAQSSFADGRGGEDFPQLTQVGWVGSFRCDEKQHGPTHQKDHRCALQFVNQETGESWNVADNPQLSAIHKKYDGAVTARIEAMSSPRFLLGGSYVDIQRIAVLSDARAIVPPHPPVP